MDAVFARREAEAGTESDDLLLQQEEAEEREQDVRDAEGAQGRREQAHGPAVPPEGVDHSPPGRRAVPAPTGSAVFTEWDGLRGGPWAIPSCPPPLRARLHVFSICTFRETP